MLRAVSPCALAACTPGDAIAALVGDDVPVPCVDGLERPYLNLDAAASTSALPAVANGVVDFLPWYSSVHRGAGYKSQFATAAYEEARAAILGFSGRTGRDDVAIICRNTTEAINHLAHCLRLRPDDVIVTTVVEHHANLLPWARMANLRFVECGPAGTFEPTAVEQALNVAPAPRLLAITGASNVSGWLPPLDPIIALAHARGVPVVVDGAQLAAHRALPSDADFIAFSGHKMYAPFGAGALIGPRDAFERGDPFLVGGGAVDLVDLDEVVWTSLPDRAEAGSPNVLGAVALASATRELQRIGWPAIAAHDALLARMLRAGLASIPGVRLLGPSLEVETLPIATFVVDAVPHALIAARLSAEHAIGVRHGCFCAHPYLQRLLGLNEQEIGDFRANARRHDRRSLPGAVRVSTGISTTASDIHRLLDAVHAVTTSPPPIEYVSDPGTGDYRPSD
jgi:selenocysteine lyase/cysteine desulfurase